jgi:hypothetical protein
MIKLLQWFVRLAGLGALALGISFILAPGRAPLSLHMALGGIVAIVLAILAGWALIHRIRVPAAIVALLWAAATIYIGVNHTGGTAEEIIHPLLGIGAMGLAEMLAAALARAKARL